MSGALVVDASVAIKWVYAEEDSPRAVSLLSRRLVAPDLIHAECANILWKKVRRGEMSEEEAADAAAALLLVEWDMVPSAQLISAAIGLAVELDHPAYDCFYLELCRRREAMMVTADVRLIRRLAAANSALGGIVVALSDFG